MKDKLSFAMLCATLCAGSLFAAPAHRPLQLHDALADKNFYLLSLFQQKPELQHALVRDAALKQLTQSRAERIAGCKEDSACVISGALWSEDDIAAATRALGAIYARDATFKRVLDEQLETSGTYALYDQQGGGERLKQAWLTCVRGVNEILSVYGQGHAPRYPKIDSASVDIHSADFTQAIAGWRGEQSGSLFFERPEELALVLLRLNHRDEAARFEPIEATENHAALLAIPHTDWKKYPYTVIIVPGAGPEDDQTALSPAGRERTRLAAEAFREGKAPYVLLSGGFVHPSQTRYAEAVEMKKYLMQEEHLPESAILLDPYARHTTTNLRNAVREVYRYGMPMEKPELILTDTAQTAYIFAPSFAERCRQELHYVPYQPLQSISSTRLSMLPNIESLEQDPIDPLDP